MNHPPLLTDPGELSGLLLPQGTFTPDQLAAIAAPLRPEVIIAGAGSGKTTVMAARVVWLVGSGQVRPDEVLGLTFTNKAASGLQLKIAEALEAAGYGQSHSDEGRPTVMTYDAFAARIVADYGSRVGVELQPVMVTGAQRYQLATRVVTSSTGPFEVADKYGVGTLVERVLKLDESMTSHLVSADEIRQETAAYEAELAAASASAEAHEKARERLDLLHLVDDYQRLKAHLGLAEFADQMRVACDVAARFPSVGEALRDQYRIVLLDEYQDTSTAQVRLLKSLFGGPGGLGHPVTAVGDPFQAIYGWRGAAASNIVEFSGEFPLANGDRAPQRALPTNLRSDRRIVAVGNAMTAELRADEYFARLTQGLDLTLKPADGKPEGCVWAADFVTWDDEVSWVAERIVDDHRSGRAGAWKDIAVLTRNNAELGPIFHELTRRNVPCEIVGLGGLLSVPEVGFVVDILRLLDDVTANPQLIALLSGPRWRVGPDDLAALGDHAAGLFADDDPSTTVSLLEAMGDLAGSRVSAEAQRRMRRCAAELAQLRRHTDEPIPDLIGRVIQVTGLDAELASRADGGSARAQLDAFVAVAGEFVDIWSDQSLGALLAYLDAERDTNRGLDQATVSETDSVKLMTIHRAKGLDWKVVYLPGLVDKKFPSTRVTDNWVTAAEQIPATLRGDAQSFPELVDYSRKGLDAYAQAFRHRQLMAENRLAYVATTRAKHHLVVSCHVWRAGTSTRKTPSPYYETIYTRAQGYGTVLAHVDVPPDENPTDDLDAGRPWPVPIDPDDLSARRHAADLVAAAGHEPSALADAPLAAEDRELADEWSRGVDRIIAQASRRTQTVELPSSLSVSNLMRAHADPGALAADLLRPMPRKPSLGNRVGTRFHEWVERFYGMAPTLDAAEEELPAARPGDDEVVADLISRFREGRYAGLVPVGVEVAFMLVLEGQLVRGRIDAVFRSSDPRFDYQVVDWKTFDRPGDGLQLALYRVAWAQATGVDPARVDAVFYHVRSGQVERPATVASERELAAMVGELTAHTRQP